MEIAELYQKGLELDAEAERLEESGRKDPAVNCQTAYQKAAVLRKEAVSYWKQAAEQGHVDAQYRLALYFHYGKKNNQAFYWCKMAAEQGLPMAQYTLGSYYCGVGVVADTRKSIFWREKAFENGVLAAGEILAQYYRDRRNYKKAMEWNLKVIEFPDVPIYAKATAEYNMGEMQQNHFKDMEKALHWYKRSASNGNGLSAYRLGEYYEAQGDLEQATQWYCKSAEAGFLDAQLWLNEHGFNSCPQGSK